MEVKMIEKLKDKLCEELEQVSRKNAINAGDLEAMYKLIVSIEKLMKIEEMEDGGASEYSGGRYSRAGAGDKTYNRNYARNSYADGDSYANENYSGRMHYVRGHYSRADGNDMIRDKIQRMIEENRVSGADRSTLERAMDILE